MPDYTNQHDELEVRFTRIFGRDTTPEEKTLFTLARLVGPYYAQDEEELAQLCRGIARRKKTFEAEILERDAA
jgi:hypothetical protein